MTATNALQEITRAAGVPAGALPDSDLAVVRGVLRDLREQALAAVDGGGGLAELARLVAAAVQAPVAIVVPDLETLVVPAEGRDEMERAQLEQWVRERLGGRPAVARSDVVAELPVSRHGRMIGLVAVLDCGCGPSLDPLTPWILEIAAAAVVTAAVAEESRIETEHRLRGSFLEQLRDGERLTGPEISRRAARLGCDVSGGAVVLCVEVNGSRPRLVALTIADEYPGAFAEAIDAHGDGLTKVWAILPAVAAPGGVNRDATTAGGVADATQAAAECLATRVRQHGAVGLSRFHSDPTEFPRALDEAELMLDVMRKVSVPPGEQIVDGTYKLLFRLLASHPDELHTYHAATIGPLVQHDGHYRTDLVRTLEAYLDTNCNMNVTADTVFAHRHTIAHRLERICELTGLDPTVHEDREQLGLGLKIHRLTA